MAGSVWRIGVLGPLVLEQDGAAVSIPSGRQRTLLVVLLRSGGLPVSRDRLIDELWGEHPPASAVSALHVHLSKLRALLGGLVVLESAGYSLEPGVFQLDVWQFDALVERARVEPEQARPLLAEALALFRGDPLCDVPAEGSIGEWRRELEEKRLQATIRRIDAELAAGESGQLVAELERLTSRHQFEERLWGQFMLALYRAGRQADALDAYQRARRLLAGELGLEPGEPLTQLQQRILDHDPELGLGEPTPARATPTPRAASSNLPVSVTKLVGREAELVALAGLLADPDVRLITLAGPGGVGKTRLLLELTRRHEHEYADGAVFVRLERLTDPGLVTAEIAGALVHRDGADGPSADGLVAYLRDRELLLAIDNFEHLLSAAVQIAELLTLAPRIRVVVSSRIKLRVRGEHVYEVEPLSLPDGSEALSESPAVQLFLQCATSANRGLEIDAETTAIVAGVCTALDGLPLAIELAASRARSLTPAQIAEQLARPLSIGEHGLRDLPDRQQTLQATMGWSYDLLSPAAQEGLRAAGAFLGGFDLPAFDAVLGRDAHYELDELVEASLVRRQGAARRFELLELVRAFAGDALQAGGTVDEARARHRRYFAALIEPVNAAFDAGASPAELAAPLLADHANIRAALENAIEAGDEESAVPLALGLRPLWLAGQLRQECQELTNRLVERFDVPGEAEVNLLRAAAFIDYSPKAVAWNRRLAERAAEIGHRDALVTAYANLFAHALNARDAEEMRRLRGPMLEMLTPETSPRGRILIHYHLACDAYVGDRLVDALEQVNLSVELAEQTGYGYMLATTVGLRLLIQSALDGVMRHRDLAAGVELMERPGVQPLTAFALWLLARYAVTFDPEAAGRWLVHAERIVDELDTELWPESVLRDETMTVLGIGDLTELRVVTPPLDHTAALAVAADWLAARDPDEVSAREGTHRFTPAPG